MIVVGLTGSIGMGKTTTADLFRAAGVPVNDADATVHRLYAGSLAPEIEAAFPGSVVDGVVDRARLGAAVFADPDALRRLEAIVHPAVRAEERVFLEDARAAGAPVAVLDIPLLFEAGRAGDVDHVVVVTADADIQRTRVLARPGMTEARLAAILARQMPDAEKRRRADTVIDTGRGIEPVRAAIADLLGRLVTGTSAGKL